MKDSNNAVFYPQTHEKAVVDSNGVNLQTKLASITTPTYVTAWDGASTPVVANIPAGVTVTYNTTTYTGTLAASASTANKTYLVSTGTTDNYNRYVTQLSGSTYSWQNLGSTEIDLSDYATKVELSQLEHEVHNLSGKYYGIFEDAESLPEGDAAGYAFVGTTAPFAIYQFDGTDWADSGATVDSIQGEPGVGFDSVTTNEDGSFTIHLTDGGSVTIDLTHNHPDYYSKVVGTSQPSGGFLPDVAYNLGEISGTVAFILAPAVTGKLNHYFWMFDTGATAPTVTFPSTGITWAAGSAPTVVANKHYEISILGGLAYYSEV